jgi:hypothetical protein
MLIGSYVVVVEIEASCGCSRVAVQRPSASPEFTLGEPGDRGATTVGLCKHVLVQPMCEGMGRLSSGPK